jgi:acyl carrier protein
MNGTRQRLVKCFALALPNLPADLAEGASIHSVSAWDSLATINILALVEEEFGIRVPDADLENFESFGLIADYLEKRTDVSKS